MTELSEPNSAPDSQRGAALPLQPASEPPLPDNQEPKAEAAAPLADPDPMKQAVPPPPTLPVDPQQAGRPAAQAHVEAPAPAAARPAPPEEPTAPRKQDHGGRGGASPRHQPGGAAKDLGDQVKNAHQQARPPLDPNLRTLREVTTPLQLSEPHFPVETAELNAWLSRLRHERILVLASASRLVVGAALHAIANDKFLRTTTRKLTLRLDSTQLTANDGFELCLLPDHVEDTAQRGQEGTLLVVEATKDPWAAPFLDDLFRDPLTRLPVRTAHLLRLNRHVLVLTSGSLLAEREGGWGQMNEALPCFHLSFHRQLIEREFLARDAAICSRLIALYEAQRDAGRFGTTDQQQHDTLSLHLRNRTLQELLNESRERPAARSSALGTDVLLDTALFVACFLNQLSPGEFQEVLFDLLGDELDPTWRPTFEHEPPRLLKQRWREQSHQLLSSAGISVGRDTNGGQACLNLGVQSVDELKQTFRTDRFFLCNELQGRLERSRWLFDPRPAVAGAFITLLAENAAFDPHAHDDAWLCGLLLEAVAEPEFAARARRAQASARLLRQLLAGGLAETVKKCFVRLCESGRHDLVLGLTAQLANARDFDQLLWIKRSLDQGNVEVAERAYALLLTLSLRDDTGAIETSCKWLQLPPKPGLSVSHLALLRLCIELGELTLWLPEQIGLGEHAGARLLCLTNPRSVGIVLEQSLTSSVDALLAEQDRWCFELGRVIDLWLVPARVAELLGERVMTVKLHLLQVWLDTTTDEEGGQALPPHRGMFQSILLAGAALTVNAEAREALAAETRRVLGQPSQRLLRAAVDRRIRAIEACFSEVVDALDDHPSLEEHRVSKILRQKLRAQRATLTAFRTAQRQPPQQ